MANLVGEQHAVAYALPPRRPPRHSTQRAPGKHNQSDDQHQSASHHDNGTNISRVVGGNPHVVPYHELVDAEPERAHELLVDLRRVALREVRHLRRCGRGRRGRQRRHAPPLREGEEGGGGEARDAAGGRRGTEVVAGRVFAATGGGDERTGVGGGGAGGGGGEEEWHSKGEDGGGRFVAGSGSDGQHPGWAARGLSIDRRGDR